MRPWVVGANPLEPVGSSVSDGITGRVADPVTGAGLFNPNTDPNVVGIDAITGSDAPAGTDVGFGAGVMALLERGVYNGDFSLPPPRPELPINSDPSDVGYNPLPHWVLETVSGAGDEIQFYWVADVTRPSGGYIQVVASGAGSCRRQLRQLLRIASSGSGRFAHSFGATVEGESVSGPTGLFAQLEADYLQQDAATVTGGLGSSSIELSVLDDTIATLEEPAYNDASQAVPVDAAYAEITIGALAVSPSGAGSFRILDVSHNKGGWELLVADITDTTKNPGRIYQDAGSLVLSADSADTGSSVMISAESLMIPSSTPTPAPGGGESALWVGVDNRLRHMAGPAVGTYLLSGQLVPLDFVLLNVPAGATTQMQPSDVALAIGTPRLRIPWAGSIVGMSYRLSGAITAGTLNFQATVGGSNVWSPWGALTTAASQHDATSQAPGTDTYTTSDALGIQVVTSGAFTPITMDIHAILWIVVDYGG